LTASLQKNHPTVGWVPSGATVEQASPLRVTGDGRHISILLNDPDFTNANRIADALRGALPGARVQAEHAGKVSVDFAAAPANLVAEIAQLENIPVNLQRKPRIVVNERTGTVVAGADVRVGAVSITHGNLKVEINTHYAVSQPASGIYERTPGSISSVVVPETRIGIGEPLASVVRVPEGSTVAELVTSLKSIRLSTRDIIAVLQSIKAAGALDGELVIQ